MEERHFEVILEGLRSDFKSFGEGLQGVHQRIDETNRKLEELTVETRQNSKWLLENLMALREANERHEGRLAKSEERLTRSEETLAAVKEILDRHDHGIDSLETRMEHLERKAG
ncbi:MAG: hypothetical protein HYU64_16245 [Armatimonadetes bacterium]|nr:hypothetical protein [Armatimonadota bacterium]